MKILHIQKVKGVYGTEKNVRNTSLELIRRGHQVDFLIYTEPGWAIDGFLSELRAGGAGVTTVSMPRSISLRALRTTANFLRGHAYDIIHTHLIHGDMYGITAARLAGCPCIISTKHNDDPFRRRFFFRWTEKYLNRRCARIITISRFLKDFICGLGTPQDKITVVYNGIGPAADKAAEREKLRKSLGFKSGETVFFNAARLIAQKGQADMIRAFARLAEERKDVHLLIAGTGDREQSLKHLVRERGIENRIQFLGFRNDVNALMAASDVFVHPSLWEGFGTVFLEAMQAGLPVVATQVSAIPEVVQDEETGMLVKPGDQDALYKRLSRLAEDPELGHRLGDNGKARVRAHFSLEAMADGFEHVYREVLGCGGGA